MARGMPEDGRGFPTHAIDTVIGALGKDWTTKQMERVPGS